MVIRLMKIFPDHELVAIGEFEGPAQVGEKFKCGRYSTSPVLEVMDDSRFRTYKSIYRIDFHDDAV